MKSIAKPLPGQHPDWAHVYIERLPDDGQVLAHLTQGMADLMELVGSLTEEQLHYRYAPGKWSIKETLVHVMDVERVFTFRGLTAARQDTTPLPGFDHNAYVPASRADLRKGADLLAEYRALRSATLLFFGGLDDTALNFVGEAKDQPCTARAMIYMITGHEHHHLGILRERYLPALAAADGHVGAG
ncbi:MAG: DNA damage-inducible protein DinB [Bacteroidetes bacterium]|nr:MAG: DNA damage-inducible protein DinB [Bacteroidota bacterium]PTM12915.1 MAG: DNA damage-inducible protein DinB [Bacteroidota bacterium]